MLVLLKTRKKQQVSPFPLSPAAYQQPAGVCQSAGLGDLQPVPGFLGQASAVEVFSAHKQRSCSEGAPRDTTTGDEKTNASFPNAIKTNQKKNH